MVKETMSGRQSVCVIVMIILGSTLITGIRGIQQDSWITILLAIAMSIPLYFIFARIVKLYPETDLYDIIKSVFGQTVGKIIICLMSLYFLHLATLVLRNLSEFISITAMPETPQLVVMIVIMAVILYLSVSGARSIGKWAALVFPIVFAVIVVLFLLSIKQMNINYLFPMLDHSVSDFAVNGLKAFSFPFAEVVIMLGLARSFKKGENPYRIMYIALATGGFLLLLVFFRNLLILGPLMNEISFPSYKATRLIQLGDFIQRFEWSVATNYILSVITKLTVCIMAAAKGFTALFHIEKEKHTTVVLCILCTAICFLMFKNAMQMFDFINIYFIYAPFFEVILPLVLWIGVEIKNKKTEFKAADVEYN